MRVERQKFKSKSGVTVYDDTIVTSDMYNSERRSTVSVSERTKNGPVYYSQIFDREASMHDVLNFADRLNTLQRNWIRLGRKVK